MKKLISLLLCAAMTLALCACRQNPPGESGMFYYRRIQPAYGTDDGIIAPESRNFSIIDDDLAEMLERYFAGPEARSLESPFPRNTHVISWGIQDETLTLNLSEPFAALSGVDLTVACSCIARTFLEILPIEKITIQVMHKTLNGQKNISLSREDLSFVDDGMEQLRTTYQIYYADQHLRYLIGIDAAVSLANQEDIIRYLIQLLMTPPYNSELFAPIPYGTKLLDVTVKNGLCTLNFSPEFEANSWQQPEALRLTLLSIVNTLTQIDGIEQVEFCIDGNLMVQYGSLNISAPFVREERAIGPVRTGINEFDATLYVSNGSGEYLTPMPTKIRQTAGIQQEELILKALMRCPSINGFYTTIPSATVINSISTDHGICHIDLSKDFLTNPDTLELSVHAIVASVCTVKNVTAVQLTINGKIPSGIDPKLFGVLSPQLGWFA